MDHYSDSQVEDMLSSYPLPHDLYPLLIAHIHSLPLLATLSQVDRSFLTLTRKKLYANVWVRPWERGCERKFRGLMRSLSEGGDREGDEGVAGLVKDMDIRFYPMGAGSDLEDQCIRALTKTNQLTGLSWTRDTTFTEGMINALTNHDSDVDPAQHVMSPPSVKTASPRTPLRRLEINGHLTYPVNLLHGFEGLRELKIILPSREVALGLVAVCKDLWDRGMTSNGSTDPGLEANLKESRRHRPRSTTGLTSLDLIAPNPRYINDTLLLSLAPYLENLEVFKLLGTGHVGPKGYLGVIRQAAEGLRELSLEGCGHGDEEDMLDEDLYLERESPLSVGVNLPSLKILWVSELAFQRLLLADRSRQEQADVRRMGGANNHVDEDVEMADSVGDDNTDHTILPATPTYAVAPGSRNYPVLDSKSFFPATLQSLHVTRRGAGDERASHIISAASEMWPRLKKLFFTDYLVASYDLNTIGKNLPELETLMIRMSESRPNPKLLAMYIARFPALRAFHLSAGERRPGVDGYTTDDLLFMARACGPALEQIGWANRVYMVKRRKVIDWEQDGIISPRMRGWSQLRHDQAADGMSDATGVHWAGAGSMMVPNVSEKEEVYLDEWQRPGVVPEAFQIWRA